MSEVPFFLGENIMFRNDEEGEEYSDHLFVNEQTGTARIKLNGWEKRVIEEERKREDYRCWYRNPSRGSDALALYHIYKGVKKQFCPDFLILWIDAPEVQYINFIDPKGLLHFTQHDPKIQFYKKIKELEARLAPTAGDKRIVLNSFIMSATKAAQLKQWWHMGPADYEAMNVYTLDDSRCVEKMLEKLEIQVAI